MHQAEAQVLPREQEQKTPKTKGVTAASTGAAPKESYRFPGLETVIHGNGAVAHVMGHVCGGVIGLSLIHI